MHDISWFKPLTKQHWEPGLSSSPTIQENLDLFSQDSEGNYSPLIYLLSHQAKSDHFTKFLFYLMLVFSLGLSHKGLIFTSLWLRPQTRFGWFSFNLPRFQLLTRADPARCLNLIPANVFAYYCFEIFSLFLLEAFKPTVITSFVRHIRYSSINVV